MTYQIIDTHNQNYIAAQPHGGGPTLYDDPNPHALTLAESQSLSAGHHLAGVAMNGRSALSRAQQSDTAITHAQAFLIASAPVLGALGAVTSGFVLLGWLVAGGPAIVWIGVELLLFGVAAFVTLGRHRRAGLEHTPAGVERHEIDARARIAMHIVDRHCEMVERLKGVRQ